MRMTLVLGFLATALGGAVLSMSVLAQDTHIPDVRGTSGGGGGDTYSPAEVPLGPTRIPMTDGDGANPTLPGYVAGLPLCTTQLGDLRRVGAWRIDHVDHGVSVAQICEQKNLIDQQEGVASIRSALKRNKVMIEALRRAGGFVPDDVVAIVLDGEGAKLYVHRNNQGSGGGGASSAALL